MSSRQPIRLLRSDPFERDVHDVTSFIRQLDHEPAVRRLGHRRSAERELALALGQLGLHGRGDGSGAHSMVLAGCARERMPAGGVFYKSVTEGLYRIRR
jgi:hypothetical protein